MKNHKWPVFRLFTTSPKVIYGVGMDDSLYEIELRNSILSHKKLVNRGYDSVVSICWFRECIYSLDELGFLYCFRISQGTTDLVRKERFEKATSLSCSQTSLYILHQ
jgi:hypothetical protein